MAQLIQMRQRIKSVETIKQITHAMRLVSMSAHARLNKEQRAFQVYHNHIAQLFATLRISQPQWNNSILMPTADLYSYPLLILIGSQKGLCGSFNNNLFQSFN